MVWQQCIWYAAHIYMHAPSSSHCWLFCRHRAVSDHARAPLQRHLGGLHRTNLALRACSCLRVCWSSYRWPECARPLSAAPAAPRTLRHVQAIAGPACLQWAALAAGRAARAPHARAAAARVSAAPPAWSACPRSAYGRCCKSIDSLQLAASPICTLRLRVPYSVAGCSMVVCD